MTFWQMSGLALFQNWILFHCQKFSFHQNQWYLLSDSVSLILRNISLMSAVKAYLNLLNRNRIANKSFNLFGPFSIAPFKELPLLFFAFASKPRLEVSFILLTTKKVTVLLIYIFFFKINLLYVYFGNLILEFFINLFQASAFLHKIVWTISASLPG